MTNALEFGVVCGFVPARLRRTMVQAIGSQYEPIIPTVDELAERMRATGIDTVDGDEFNVRWGAPSRDGDRMTLAWSIDVNPNRRPFIHRKSEPFLDGRLE